MHRKQHGPLKVFQQAFLIDMQSLGAHDVRHVHDIMDTLTAF